MPPRAATFSRPSTTRTSTTSATDYRGKRPGDGRHDVHPREPRAGRRRSSFSRRTQRGAPRATHEGIPECQRVRAVEPDGRTDTAHASVVFPPPGSPTMRGFNGRSLSDSRSHAACKRWMQKSKSSHSLWCWSGAVNASSMPSNVTRSAMFLLRSTCLSPFASCRLSHHLDPPLLHGHVYRPGPG